MRLATLLAALALLLPASGVAQDTMIPAKKIKGHKDYFEACADENARGGGDATSDTYAWACGNYNWSAERGGAASFTDPVTAGGVAYDVTCTGAFAPDPLCLVAGEVVRVNAMADILIALDMVREGGDVYLPNFPGKNYGLYQTGRCGETVGGTPLPCVKFRYPFEFVLPKTIQVLGNRTLHLEGSDFNGFDDRERTGVWLLSDNGHDDAQSVDSDGYRVPRRMQMIGGQIAVGPCMQIPGEGALECTVFNTISSKSAGTWAEAGEILGTQSDPTALCIRNDLANTGMCADDSRITCNVDGHCTNVGLAGPCTGFADLIQDKIDDMGGFPVRVDYQRNNIDPLGNNQTTLMSGKFWVQSVSATACETYGVQVALANSPGPTANTGPWPFLNEQVGAGVSDNNILYVFDKKYAQSGLAYTGGTMAPAQSPMYGILAADVPTCSASTSGLMVVIADDDGSCTDTVQGTLDGGTTPFAEGTTANECYCDGTDWIDADCEGETYGGNRGCYDEASHITRAYAQDSYVTDVAIQHAFSYNGGSTTEPIFDNMAEGGEENTYKRVTVRNSFGRLFDMGNHRLDSFTVENLLAPGMSLISVGFMNTGSNVGPMRISNTRSARVFSLGQGSSVDVHDIVLDGNIVERELFLSQGAWGVRIERIRGWGNYGRLLTLEPSNTQVSGPVLMGDVVLRNHQNFDINTSWGGMDGFVVAHDFRGNASYDAQKFIGPYVFDNVHLETVEAGCFLYYDNTGTPINMPRRTIIRNSSVRGTDPTDATTRLVCAAANTTSAQMVIGDSDSMATIYSNGQLPAIFNSQEGDAAIPDNPYWPISVAESGDCDLLPDGTVVYVYDGHATPCQDTDGVLDSGAVAAKCECDQSGGNWVPMGTAY